MRVHFAQSCGDSGDRIMLEPARKSGKKNRLAVSRALARGIGLVWNHAFDLAAQFIINANLTVVHEQPALMRERMAVDSAGRRAGGGAYMRKKEGRADVARNMAQVFVRPGGQHFTIKTRLALFAIPADAETVAIGVRSAFGRMKRLVDER